MIYRWCFFFLVFFGPVAFVRAQVCTSPGEPAAVISFGAVGVPFSLAGKTGPRYTIADAVCTPENTIALRSKAFLCNPNWHLVPGDHTPGDDNGNFLMVNAVEGDGEFYRDTVGGLCPGSVFIMEAFVVNLMRKFACNGASVDPDLLFSITDLNGQKIGEVKAGALPTTDEPIWVPVRLQFVCPTSGKVIVRIANRNGKSCGGEFGIDDIRFSPCTRTVPVTAQGGRNSPVEICQESQENYLLQANVAGFNNPRLQWQANSNDRGWEDIEGGNGAGLLRKPTSWGLYNYRLKIIENNNLGCSYLSEVFHFNIYPQPFAQGVNYVFGCYGYPFKFQGAGGAKYEWSGPSGFSSVEQAPEIPSLRFSDVGRYVVKVTTNQGCIGYDSTDLVVYEKPVAQVSFTDTAICIGDSVRLFAGGAPHYALF